MCKVNFLVIDDSKIDCFIAEKVIRGSGWSKNCQTFQRAGEALEYLLVREPDPEPTIVFLDEYMPLMSGLDFVKAFDELPIRDKESYYIYLLSSSMTCNPRTAPQHLLIRSLLSKPLLTGTIQDLMMKDLKCPLNE